MYLALLLCLAIPALTAPWPLAATSPQTTSALVDLGYSKYQGTRLGVGVNQYLSVRYAAPPL